MRPRERREVVLREVLSGNGHVDELSARLGVSESTIRRDLQRLVDEGHVMRTYGGAVAGGGIEPSLDEKAQAQRAEKAAIAAVAAAEVQPGETVILDAGSTTGALAWELRRHDGLTVFANGLNAVVTFYEHQSVRLIVIGGLLRTLTQSMVGPLAEESLRRVYADRAFLGANGLTVEHGISSPTDAQSRLKGLMAEHAREVYVLADHTKLGALPFPSLTPLRLDYTLITTGGNLEGLAAFERATHVDVVVASVAGSTDVISAATETGPDGHVAGTDAQRPDGAALPAAAPGAAGSARDASRDA
jgi:DeoR/GlpR family transcriptional regulator of sugar metabolism